MVSPKTNKKPAATKSVATKQSASKDIAKKAEAEAKKAARKAEVEVRKAQKLAQAEAKKAAKKVEAEAKKAQKKMEQEAKKAAKKAEAEVRKAQKKADAEALKATKKAEGKAIKAIDKANTAAKKAAKANKVSKASPSKDVASKSKSLKHFKTTNGTPVTSLSIKPTDMHACGLSVKAILGKARAISNDKYPEVTKVFNNLMYSPRADTFILVARAKMDDFKVSKKYDIIGIEFKLDGKSLVYRGDSPIYYSNVKASEIVNSKGELLVGKIMTMMRHDRPDAICLV